VKKAKKIAKAAGKKNNKKGKKADHSAAINKAEAPFGFPTVTTALLLAL
jgi:hypothetical protein